MDRVEWDRLLTLIVQVNPMYQKMEVVDWGMGNYNTNKVKSPLQDQSFVEVGHKTHQIGASWENFDP